MVEASSTRATTAATATGTRRLRVNFARRYAALGGRARTGSSRARLWRFDLADDPLDLAIGFAAQLLGIKRRGAGQQLVEQHAEAVDVAAGIDVKAADVGLLGGHVLGRAYELAKLGEQRFVGEALAVRRLGDAATTQTTIYLTGGATAVLFGWRETTIDVDLKLVPDQHELLREIPRLKEKLQLNVELATPSDFIPVPAGWEERSSFILREGRLSFHHFDLAVQALAKARERLKAKTAAFLKDCK